MSYGPTSENGMYSNVNDQRDTVVVTGAENQLLQYYRLPPVMLNRSYPQFTGPLGRNAGTMVVNPKAEDRVNVLRDSCEKNERGTIKC